MKTITLEKNGEKFQVNDRRKQKPQSNFHTFKSGHLGNDTESQKPLLPTDRQSGNKDKNKTPQRNRKSNKPLYPLGTIKNEDK